jgi:DNA-binding helix-hairpin-helix protein with protein kinase domain
MKVPASRLFSILLSLTKISSGDWYSVQLNHDMYTLKENRRRFEANRRKEIKTQLKKNLKAMKKLTKNNQVSLSFQEPIQTGMSGVSRIVPGASVLTSEVIKN